MDEPSLSDKEQRILAEIERNLAQEDPDFVRNVTTTRSGQQARRIFALSIVGLLLGLVLLLANTVSLTFGVVGFLIMLASIVGIATSIRRQAAGGRSAGNVLRDAWRRAEDRMRSRRPDA
jgi:hypothetical protein